MFLLRTVFYHEWRQFLRQRWMPASLILFIVIVLLSIGSGNQAVQLRLIQIDSIEQAYEQDLQHALKKFSDTLTAKGKAEAKNAGLPAIINYRLPQTVIKEPMPLAALSLGLMDVQPWNQQVKFTKNYTDQATVPVSNPMVLFAGNFDYSFVLVYLLPLLVIAYCNSVYASEKDAGTLSLLSVQTGNEEQVIRLKLLFRFLLIGSILTLLNVSGFALAERRSDYTPLMLVSWMVITLAYLLFWMSFAFMILALKKTAMVTALYLATAWLLLLIIIPSLINSYVQAKHPLPMKDEIASYRRHQAEDIWDTSPKILSDSFNRYNPQYASSINPAKDTLPLSNRYIAGYYDLLDRRMNTKLAPCDQQVNKRNQIAQKLMWWNPALLNERMLTGLSGNQLSTYQDFVRQVHSFQEQWQGFLYRYHFAGKNLTPADFAKFPVFRYQPPVAKGSESLFATTYVMLLSFLLLIAARIIERKKSLS